MFKKIIFILIISLTAISCEKSVEDLKTNYDKKESDILNVKNYYSELVPENYLVRIRYDSKNKIDLFVYEQKENSEEKELLFQQWNVDINNYKPQLQTEYQKKYGGKTNSFELVKERLGWTNKTFEEIYNKLNNINCIGITNNKPAEIEFGFKGMGILGYLIFEEKLTDKQKKQYSDDCTQLFYRDNVVLIYGSGAFGSLCTPEFDRKK